MISLRGFEVLKTVWLLLDEASQTAQLPEGFDD